MVVRLISWLFWFPLDCAINRIHGYPVRDTLFLYRLAWRIERTGNMF